MSKYINLHTVNIHSILYVKYTSMSLLYITKSFLKLSRVNQDKNKDGKTN